MRAAVARRANRRIIMRQVGDRLIPVGISSGRVHALNPEELAAAGETGEGGNAERSSRRSRRRNQNNPDLNQYLGQMGLAGQDLEEVCIARLTLKRYLTACFLPAYGHGGNAVIAPRARRTTTETARGGREEEERRWRCSRLHNRAFRSWIVFNR